EGEALGSARSMSPAVGEAAKRDAPDAPVARGMNGSSAAAGERASPGLPGEVNAGHQTEPAPPPGLTPPIAPVVVTPFPSQVPSVPAVEAIAPGTPPPDRSLEQALLETVGKKARGRRWSLAGGAAVVLLSAAWFLRPQPHTDKKDAPWLEAKTPQAPPPAPAPVAPAAKPSPPEAPPQLGVAAESSPPV